MASILVKATSLLGCLAGCQAQGTKPPDESRQATKAVQRYTRLVSSYLEHSFLLSQITIANITDPGGWATALSQAQAFLAQLNLTVKAYLVTGVDGPCVGSIAPIPRLGFGGLCLQDGPAAIRAADFSSVFPTGITTAASWDKALVYQRGMAMGQKFRVKGANIILA